MKRRNHERFKIYAAREGLPDPRPETGPVYPAAGASGDCAGICLHNSGGQFWDSGCFVRGGSHMAKKQVVEFERVHSGQAAHRQQVRLLAYRKRMTGVDRHGRR